MVTYSTVVLGASKISESGRILAYNTKSFERLKDLIKYDSRLLSSYPHILSMISESPTRDNIKEVIGILESLTDLSGTTRIYHYLDRQINLDKHEYIWDISDKILHKLVNTDGFDTIIFVSNLGAILGFTTFRGSQGNQIDNLRDTTYNIHKYYLTTKTKITVEFGNKVSINSNTVKLLDSLITTAKLEGRYLTGTKLYDYTDVETILKQSKKGTSYTSHITKALHSKSEKYIYTDTTSSIIHREELLKLGVLREGIEIPNLDNYTNFQLGYLKGDLSLYFWNSSTGFFRVVSLTTTNLNNPRYYVGEFSKIEKPYTILGFSGNYCVTEKDGKKYLYDILKSMWLSLSGGVVIDFADPLSKIYTSKNSEFSSVPEAKASLPFLSDIHLSLGKLTDRNTIKVYLKVGSWVVFDLPFISGYAISNHSTTIFIDRSELENVIFINNRCLIMRKGSKFFLVDEPGYHKTSTLETTLANRGLLGLLLNYSEDWTKKSEYSSIDLGNSTDWRRNIQHSFLNLFRRNRMPVSDKFNIISGMSGLLYYRIGNRINFL